MIFGQHLYRWQNEWILFLKYSSLTFMRSGNIICWSLSIWTFHYSYIQGNSRVLSELPNSTAQQPRQTPRVDISSTCKVGHKLGVSLPLLTCSPSAWLSRLLYRRGRKSRRHLWIALYFTSLNLAVLSCAGVSSTHTHMVKCSNMVIQSGVDCPRSVSMQPTQRTGPDFKLQTASLAASPLFCWKQNVYESQN